ncbi:hypothetical protein D3C81_2037280 [compost metagenome]
MLFSAPSIMCVSIAEKVSPSDIGVGLAPSMRINWMKMSELATRIFNPFKSPGSMIGCLVL